MDHGEFPNYAEYTVQKKTEGRLGLCKSLLVFGYIVFCIGYIGAVCIVTKLVALVALLPLLVYLLWLCTWRFVSYDVQYCFAAGTMIFRRIYSVGTRRTPKEKLTVHVQDAEYAGRASSPSAAAALAGVSAVYDFTSRASAPNAALLVVRDGAGRRIAVRFDCIRRVASLMRVFCPRSELDPKDFAF